MFPKKEKNRNEGGVGEARVCGSIKNDKSEKPRIASLKVFTQLFAKKTRGRERTEYDNKVPLFNVFLFELMLVQIVGETKFCT